MWHYRGNDHENQENRFPWLNRFWRSKDSLYIIDIFTHLSHFLLLDFEIISFNFYAIHFYENLRTGYVLNFIFVILSTKDRVDPSAILLGARTVCPECQVIRYKVKIDYVYT